MCVFVVYSTIKLFSCDKYGRDLRIFLKSYEPSKETDDVSQNLFCGKVYCGSQTEEMNWGQN